MNSWLSPTAGEPELAIDSVPRAMLARLRHLGDADRCCRCRCSGRGPTSRPASCCATADRRTGRPGRARPGARPGCRRTSSSPAPGCARTTSARPSGRSRRRSRPCGVDAEDRRLAGGRRRLRRGRACAGLSGEDAPSARAQAHDAARWRMARFDRAGACAAIAPPSAPLPTCVTPMRGHRSSTGQRGHSG